MTATASLAQSPMSLPPQFSLYEPISVAFLSSSFHKNARPISDSLCFSVSSAPLHKPTRTKTLHLTSFHKFAHTCKKTGEVVNSGFQSLALHFIKVSRSDSFFVSASFVSGSSAAMYPPTATAASAANTYSGNHGLLATRPANKTTPHVAPNTSCAPNATKTAIPDCRFPCIFPNSIFFGNVNDDQF